MHTSVVENWLAMKIHAQASLKDFARPSSADGAAAALDAEAQKLESVGRLAGGIAHDFNNLLMEIGGHCAVARTRAKDDPRLLENLDEIQRAADQAAMLTSQLLAFAQRQVRQPQRLDLNAATAEAAAALRRRLSDRIELVLDLDNRSAWIEADPGQIQQVLENLAANALDAMPGGGTLAIKTRTARTHVTLSVSDTGDGIPDEVKANIFEPFFTTKEVGRGTGLGLASVYGIVQQTGATIDVESKPAVGTTFTITFPAASPAPIGVQEKDEPAAGGHARVLLVDDNPSVRDLVAAGLRDRGWEVTTAALPSEALAKLENGAEYDVLITDVVMPEMSGVELVEKIRDRNHRLGTIYMSGYPREGFTLTENASFLQKPFALDELYRAVEGQLSTARRRECAKPLS